VVERNKPSIKMMQRDMRAKAMKTDRREKSKVETRRLRRAAFFGTYL
jgi:hypothetical protein